MRCARAAIASASWSARRARAPTSIRRDEVFVGDILDRASVAAALKGARYLVHAAADYRLWAPSPDELLRTNVEGTRIVMEEAHARRA